MPGHSSNARGLLNAFLAGSPQGSLLPFAAEVAKIKGRDCSDARDNLVHTSLLRRVKPVPQQQFKAHALMYLAHRDSSALDEVRERHYRVLDSTEWPRHRDCLCEMLVAARWLFAKAYGPGKLDAFLCKARETILALEPREAWLIGQSDPAARVYRRHLYVEGRLFWILGWLPHARRTMECYIGSCGRSDWKETARGKGLLAQIVIRSDFKRSLALLREQAELLADHDDTAGLAVSLGLRACVLLQKNRIEEAESVLRERWTKLQETNSEQQLTNIDEVQDYLPSVWGELLSRAWSRSGQDEETYFNRSNAREYMRDFSFSANDYRSGGTAEIPFMLLVDSLARAPGSFEEAIRALSGKALDFLAKREKQLEGAYREEELCACYANQAAILRMCKMPDLALSVLKKLELLCREIGDRHCLLTCWGNQAMILPEHADGLLERRFGMGVLLRFEEAAAYAYWDWGLLAALDGDLESARHYLKRAAYLMEELRYFGERARVFADLDSLSGEPPRAANVGG